MNSIATRAWKVFPLILAVLGVEYTFNFLLSLNNGILYSGVFIGVCTIAAGIFLKFYDRARTIDIFALMATIFYLVLYIVIRFTTDSVKIPVVAEFALTESNWDKFASYLSAGYGISQIFIGFILARVGIIAVPFCAGLVGVSYVFMATQCNYDMITIMRFMTGVFCAAGVVGFGYYLTQYWKKHFNLIFNLGVYIGIKIAIIFGQLGQQSLAANLVTWRTLVNFIGIGMIVVSAMIFILYLMVFNTDKTDPQPQIIEEYNETNNIGESKQSLWSVVFSLKSIILCLISWLVVVPYYGLATGILLNLSPVGLATMLSGSGLCVLLLPFIIIIFGSSTSMLLMASLQVFGLIALMFNPNLLLLALTTIGISAQAHCVPPVIVGETYESNHAGAMFGILNFFAMFIGCFAIQRFVGTFLEYIKNNILVGPQYTSQDYTMYLIKLSIIPCVLGLLLSVIYKIIYGKEEK